VPKTSDGDIETLRLLKTARDVAVKAYSQAMITLKAALVTACDSLRGELEPLTDFKLIAACAAFHPGDLTDPAAAMRHVLGSLARRWLALHAEIKVHSAHLKQRTRAVAPHLVAAFGVGPDIAAELLGPRTGPIMRRRSSARGAVGVALRPGYDGRKTRRGVDLPHEAGHLQ